MADEKAPITIDELPEKAALEKGAKLVIRKDGVDYKIKSDLLINSEPAGSYDFVYNIVYQAGAFVTRLGKGYESLSADNSKNWPESSPTKWKEVEVKNSGFFDWGPGYYISKSVFALAEIDGFVQVIKLQDPTRPYKSEEIYREIVEGKWVISSERGYYHFTKSNHGLLVGDTVSIRDTAWEKFTSGDHAVGFVVSVIDENKVIIVLRGGLITVDGVTFGQLYYIQADGSVTTNETSEISYIGIGFNKAMLYSGSGSVGEQLTAEQLTKIGNLPDDTATAIQNLETAIAAFKKVNVILDTYAELPASPADPQKTTYFIRDASGDPTVNTGWAIYEWIEPEGEVGSWEKIAENESQDIDLTPYIKTTDVVDNLGATVTTKPLSANQGRELSLRLSSLENEEDKVSLIHNKSEAPLNPGANNYFEKAFVRTQADRSGSGTSYESGHYCVSQTSNYPTLFGTVTDGVIWFYRINFDATDPGYSDVLISKKIQAIGSSIFGMMGVGPTNWGMFEPGKSFGDMNGGVTFVPSTEDTSRKGWYVRCPPVSGKTINRVVHLQDGPWYEYGPDENNLTRLPIGGQRKVNDANDGSINTQYSEVELTLNGTGTAISITGTKVGTTNVFVTTDTTQTISFPGVSWGPDGNPEINSGYINVFSITRMASGQLVGRRAQ